MQHRSIVAFLSGTLSPEELAEEIGAEVAAFRAALRETAKEGARRLLEAVADNRLPFAAANYVADCIVMNDDFDFADDTVRNAVFFIEDDTGQFAAQNDEWRPTREETLAALALLD